MLGLGLAQLRLCINYSATQFLCSVYVGMGTVGASVWWFMFYSEGPQLNWYHLTHHLQCSTDKENFVGVPCDIFDDPHHMTMALSVLVTIEMCNAVNRLALLIY